MMIQFNDKIISGIEDKKKPEILKSNFCESANYNSLLNHQALIKSVKRNVWSFELKSMLNNFISNVNELKHNIKFKVSGRILDSSTYILKTKTNTIINSSIETYDDIKEVQKESFEIIDSNEKQCKLLEESGKKFSKEERINQALNLNISDLNERIKDKINRLDIPPKLIYKKIGLKDLTTALNEVLNKKETVSRIRNPKKKLIDKSKLPFLPENLIASAEQKRINFENRISEFFKNLKEKYSGKPLPFLKLINQATPKAIVEALLCVLHLINHKKIELWKICKGEDDSLNKKLSEDTGQNIMISPI